MKSTPLILAAGVVFGAIYGTSALLPDMYDNPTSEVQAGKARIPGIILHGRRWLHHCRAALGL